MARRARLMKLIKLHGFDRLRLSLNGCLRMNIKDLKYLVALADTGHFGRAAERTFVSQPTLSAQLKKLEEYLGVKLVERHPKNVQLTDVGRQIVARARRMLSEGDEILALARNNTNPLAGKLKMALIPTIGPYLLPRVMQKTPPRAARARPDALRASDRGAGEARARRRNRHGHPRLARRAGRVGIATPVSGRNSPSPFRATIRSAQKSSVKVADLKGQTLLLLEDGHCLRDQALEVCSRVRCPGGRGFSCQQSGDLAAHGGGRAWRHVDAGARGRIALRRAARPYYP